MPTIRVEMLPGRNNSQKKELVSELTDAFIKTCDGNPDGVHVIITEVNADHWAVGGKLLSDN